jgi:hypothetical protein
MTRLLKRPDYRLHAPASPEAASLLAEQALTPADLDRALARLEAAEGIRIATIPHVRRVSRVRVSLPKALTRLAPAAQPAAGSRTRRRPFRHAPKPSPMTTRRRPRIDAAPPAGRAGATDVRLTDGDALPITADEPGSRRSRRRVSPRRAARERARRGSPRCS